MEAVCETHLVPAWLETAELHRQQQQQQQPPGATILAIQAPNTKIRNSKNTSLVGTAPPATMLVYYEPSQIPNTHNAIYEVQIPNTGLVAIIRIAPEAASGPTPMQCTPVNPCEPL